MDRIAQDAYYRQRVVKYAQRQGVEAAANYNKVSRKSVWKWRKRYDGTVESVYERSRRPKHSPRKQTPSEVKQVKRYSKKYRNDLLLGYEKARAYGYKRSYGCFKRTCYALLGKGGRAKKKRKNKPYERASYPGQKVQLDVKFVPRYCVADGKRYYQFTAKDECTRWTFREMYDEHSTYSARDFLAKLIRRVPFPIRLIQTDNGTEWTNALLVTKSKHKTLFEQALEDMGIEYHRIRIATPRHNGKVERQHRTDELRFYKHMRMFGLQDGRSQLDRYQRESNDHIMTCLGMRSPNQVLTSYLAVM